MRQHRDPVAYDGDAAGADTCAHRSANLDWPHRFETLLSLHLPDLTSKTVLDVDAYDGYFSFAAERLGASRVLAVETQHWRKEAGRDDFAYVKAAVASNVKRVELDVLSISRETIGEFDVVLFLGILNLMRHPLLALERMASVTKELLVVETLVDMTLVPSPAKTLRPRNWLHNGSGSCGANRASLAGMLQSVGFSNIRTYPLKRLSSLHLVGVPTRARIAATLVSLDSWRSRERLVRDLAKSALTQKRLVTHGWR